MHTLFDITHVYIHMHMRKHIYVYMLLMLSLTIYIRFVTRLSWIRRRDESDNKPAPTSHMGGSMTYSTRKIHCRTRIPLPFLPNNPSKRRRKRRTFEVTMVLLILMETWLLEFKNISVLHHFKHPQPRLLLVPWPHL